MKTIKTADGCELTTTNHHRVVMVDGKYKLARQLSAGDYVANTDGKPVLVVSVTDKHVAVDIFLGAALAGDVGDGGEPWVPYRRINDKSVDADAVLRVICQIAGDLTVKPNEQRSNAGLAVIVNVDPRLDGHKLRSSLLRLVNVGVTRAQIETLIRRLGRQRDMAFAMTFFLPEPGYTVDASGHVRGTVEVPS